MAAKACRREGTLTSHSSVTGQQSQVAARLVREGCGGQRWALDSARAWLTEGALRLEVENFSYIKNSRAVRFFSKVGNLSFIIPHSLLYPPHAPCPR